MLAAIRKTRWLAAALIICVIITLVGCHGSAMEFLASVYGQWISNLPVDLTDLGGMQIAMLGLMLEFYSYTSTMDVNSALTGDICDLYTNVDTNGDGIGDELLEMHGPWQQIGDRVTATLTPTGVTAAQIGAPTITLDLRFVDADTMTGDISYMLGSSFYQGQITVHRE